MVGRGPEVSTLLCGKRARGSELREGIIRVGSSVLALPTAIVVGAPRLPVALAPPVLRAGAALAVHLDGGRARRCRGRGVRGPALAGLGRAVELAPPLLLARLLPQVGAGTPLLVDADDACGRPAARLRHGSLASCRRAGARGALPVPLALARAPEALAAVGAAREAIVVPLAAGSAETAAGGPGRLAARRRGRRSRNGRHRRRSAARARDALPVPLALAVAHVAPAAAGGAGETGLILAAARRALTPAGGPGAHRRQAAARRRVRRRGVRRRGVRRRGVRRRGVRRRRVRPRR